MIKIVGIDPGLASTGFGVLYGKGHKVERYAFGCVTTPQDKSLSQRLAKIYSKILLLMQAEKPDLIVVEDIFSLAAYPKSGINLGKVVGVVLLAGSQIGAPAIEIPVREAKQVLTGNGNASKKQLEKAVRFLLGVNAAIRPYHASDALALALIGMYRYETIQRKYF